MKPIRFSKVLAKSQTWRFALLTPAMVFTMTAAQAGTPAPVAPAEPSPPANWINFTIGGAFVSGDESQFMQRTRSSNFYGGIEDMMFSRAINESSTFTLDGHALPGNEDYEINMRLDNSDLGYIKAGFKQFRTWYDASPGYLAGANMAASNASGLFDDERSIDRGEFYLEAGLRKENLPEITFSYRHLYRNGDKDSTCWGDSLANNSWGGVPNSNPAFKFLPALWDIDESTDIFELDGDFTIGNTEFGMGLVYEHYSQDNSRYTPRYGTKPNAPPPTNSGTSNQLLDITLTEQVKSDMFGGHVSSVTRFNDKAWLSFAASYSNQNSDIDGGSRTYGAYWSLPGQTIPGSTTGSNAKRDYAYDQMSGGSNSDQFITNLNFMWVPVQDLTVTPSLRYEKETADVVSSFRAYNTNQSWLGPESLASYTDMDAFAEAIDIRYTGLDHIVLYAKGEWKQEDEDIRRIDRYAVDGAGVPDPDLDGEFLSTDVEIDEQKYTIGANWYALSNLSFSVQAFHEERKQSLNHYEGNEQFTGNTWTPGGANNFRPIMVDHNSKIEDLNLRMTWRPMSNISLVTRYDYVHTEYENRGINWSKNTTATSNIDPAIIYPIIESGDIASHIVSQSVTWSPLAAMYVQGTISWISSETDTPEDYTGDADNDSLVGSITAGYAIDSRTELTASYSYYQAKNYVASRSYNGFPTMGYGYETEEHMIALTLTRLLTPSMIWNMRYAFITSNTDAPDQTGGYNDFDAHMISTGLQFRF
jgi:hypothetical protein